MKKVYLNNFVRVLFKYDNSIFELTLLYNRWIFMETFLIIFFHIIN